MKLYSIQLLMVAALAGFASAAPMRVVVVDVSAYRIGHPAAAAAENIKPITREFTFAPVQTTTMTRTRPCGLKMKGKVIQLSNRLRKAFGLPLIETNNHVPEIGYGTPDAPIRYFRPAGFEPFERPHAPRPMHIQKPSFGQRLEMALMELGPWEGRLVTFILGCGLGVLLRMLWVVCTISYKAFTKPNDEEVIFATIDAEDIIVAPPRYEVTYPEEKKDAKDTVAA